MLGNVRARDTAHGVRNAPPNLIVFTPSRLACQLTLIEAPERKTLLENSVALQPIAFSHRRHGNWAHEIPACNVYRMMFTKQNDEARDQASRKSGGGCDLP